MSAVLGTGSVELIIGMDAGGGAKKVNSIDLRSLLAELENSSY